MSEAYEVVVTTRSDALADAVQRSIKTKCGFHSKIRKVNPDARPVADMW